ncbi:helix-turn-helix domain-containing protein [Blautia sp. XA-2221]|uniref:helix-turn-helix domain-containing protein n=1 Tax=Blautia sp. XA-2221 TaxID=2903961 RepID=UPI002377E56C|nr:helix-turn-helix transcriptional regulator [Blautia sp. XA-2221]
MKTGEMIRMYRKNRNLTQEEMANRLGVTAPAVNKWENNVSLPDITLLAPIARLLETTPDTLLCFREELSLEEVNAIVQEAGEKFQKESYGQVFEFCRKKIHQYPGCDNLVVQLAVVLDSWRILKNILETEMKKYDQEILGWYKQALESEDTEIKERAAEALFSYYFRNEQYEEADGCLEYFSAKDPGRKIHKALLYEKRGDRPAAWKAYEELLFQTGNFAEMVLGGLFSLAEKDGDLEKARMFTEKLIQLAELFETGEYHKASAKMSLALAEKNRNKQEQYMEEVISAVDQLDSFRSSDLYAHMEFKEMRREFAENMKKTLRESFQKESACQFSE